MDIYNLHKSLYMNEYFANSATENADNSTTSTTSSVFLQAPKSQTNSQKPTFDTTKLESFFNGANYSKTDFEKNFGTKISDKEYTEFKTKYHDPLKAKDYVFDNVDQEGINSCYMLSGLSARKDDIEKSKCMKWNDDGSCDISFYKVDRAKSSNVTTLGALKDRICGNYTKNKYDASDVQQTFHVSPEELKKTDFQGTVNGQPSTIKLSNTEDITAKAMEVALLKYHNNEAGFQGMSGSLEKIQKMLYGKNAPEVKEAWAGRITKSQIDKAATCQLPVKGGMLSGSEAQKYLADRSQSGTIKVADISGKTVYIGDQHAYTVNGYDEKTNSVSISNPHLNNLNSTKDDIVLPFNTFRNLFCIEYIDN